MIDRFSDEETYRLNTYNVGNNVVKIEHQAVYIGSGNGDDGGDWLNISRVFINDNAVYDHKVFGYLPQPTSDEQVLKITLAYPQTVHAKDIIEKHEQYKWQISKMSALEKFFNRKNYLNLTRELKKLEGDYMFIEGIINATSILKRAELLAEKKSADLKKPVDQPGSY